MEKAGMDAEGLNRDCKIDIIAAIVEGSNGRQFVPIYSIIWQEKTNTVLQSTNTTAADRWRKMMGGKNIAFLEFLEPTRTVRALRVYDAHYIRRKPVKITNLDELLKQTNNLPANPFVPDRQ